MCSAGHIERMPFHYANWSANTLCYLLLITEQSCRFLVAGMCSAGHIERMPFHYANWSANTLCYLLQNGVVDF